MPPPQSWPAQRADAGVKPAATSPLTRARRRRLYACVRAPRGEYWLPLLIWLVLIYFFSTDSFSADQTSRIIEPLLRFFFPALSQDEVALWHGVIRKLSHVGEYTILALLAYRAVRLDANDLLEAKIRSFELVVLVALTDEFSLWRDDNINQAFPGTTGSVASRRPIAGYGNITVRGSQGQSIFHSLMSRVEKRFTKGVTFLSSYTWSKSIDNFSGRSTTGDSGRAQDQRNWRGERGVSAFDATHRLVFNSIYELPLGKGHRWLDQGPASFVFGGWQISGISTFMTGRPLTPILRTDNSGTGNTGNDRPNRVGDPILARGARTTDRWFNIDAFVAPAPGTFGNAGRNVVRGPGTNNIDLSFIKNNRFGENRNVQFRTEIFNVPNHPNFNMPNRDFATTQFGKIFSSRPSRQIQLGLKLVF